VWFSWPVREKEQEMKLKKITTELTNQRVTTREKLEGEE
jgi:hypothetical protein